tara:strand:+ start:444 stop:713 length:270 start_codon:yes stop_codon:yes gene_type:complete
MSEKKWMPAVRGMLEQHAMRSVDIERDLSVRFRHAPSARSITAALNGDPRFRKMGEAHNSSLFKRKSHKVAIWGLTGVRYSEVWPYDRL